MRVKRKVPNSVWESMMARVLMEPVSKQEIKTTLQIKSEYTFNRYVIKQSNNQYRLYTLTPGYYSVAKVENEFNAVNDRLTSMAMGFVRTRKLNQGKMFDLLQMVPEDRKLRILSDPLYQMFQQEVSKLGTTYEYQGGHHNYQHSESAQAFQ